MSGVVVVALANALLMASMSTAQAQPPDCVVRGEAKLSNDGNHVEGEVQDRSGETSGRLNHQFPDGDSVSIAPDGLACVVSETEATARFGGKGTYKGDRNDALVEFQAGPEREDGTRQGAYRLRLEDVESGRLVFEGAWSVVMTVHSTKSQLVFPFNDDPYN
jgi:hypothetical protein